MITQNERHFVPNLHTYNMVSFENPIYGFVPPTKRSFKKRKFTKEEDQKLRELVAAYGEKNWKNVSDKMPGRSQRQCRDRWKQYLSPNVNAESWTKEDDNVLIQAYNRLGPKWSEIIKLFPNRSYNNVRNRGKRLMKDQLLKRQNANIILLFQKHPDTLPLPEQVSKSDQQSHPSPILSQSLETAGIQPETSEQDNQTQNPNSGDPNKLENLFDPNFLKNDLDLEDFF